jgi:hypothetical protein
MPSPRPATGHDAEAPSLATAPNHGWQRRELVIWGAHGGAGTTTLAVWLQPAWDMGAMRPEPDPPYPAAVAHGRALVVACRNTAWSARQATKALATVARHGAQVAVLAVVSDGWPEPATATRRFVVPAVGPEAEADPRGDKQAVAAGDEPLEDVEEDRWRSPNYRTGARNSVTSCDLGVFVEETAEPVAPDD